MPKKDYDVTLYAKRMKQIRERLTTPEKKYSQYKVAEESGLTQNQVYRLEQGEGSIPNLLVLLGYYHRQGVNLNWLLSEDNAQENFWQPVAESEAQAKRAEFRAFLEAQFSELLRQYDNLPHHP